VLGDRLAELGARRRRLEAGLDLGPQRPDLVLRRGPAEAEAVDAREAVPGLREGDARRAAAGAVGRQHRADAAAAAERAGDHGVVLDPHEHRPARALRQRIDGASKFGEFAGR
jgi:hypothetical protein